MPIGIVNSLWVKALGLASVAAITLWFVESVNGTSGTGQFATVVAQHESPRTGAPEPVENERKETESDHAKFAIRPQKPNANPKIEPIDWLLLDMEMGVFARNFKFGDHVPIEARTPSLQRKILQQDFARLRAMRRQLPRSTKELEQQKQKFGLSHPLTKSTEAKVMVIDQFLQKVVDEQSDQTDSEKSSRDYRRLKEFFQTKPTHPEAKYSQPLSLDGIVLTKTQWLLGYEATDNQGNLLRRFVDTNLDYKLDTWVYFKEGRETYRDIDRNFDEVVDEVQLRNGDWVRIGNDTNRDFKIDSWSERRLSDLKR